MELIEPTSRLCLDRKSFSRQAIGGHGKEVVKKKRGRSYLCGNLQMCRESCNFVPRKSIALVVQWIERKFPKRMAGGKAQKR